MRLVCHHTFCIYPSNWYLRFCRTSLVSAGKCDILTDRDILGGRTPPYLCSRPCLPSFREIVRAVLEKNAEMTNIEGKRQGRSNLGCTVDHQRSECTAALAHRPSSECILPTTVLKRAPPVAMAATDVPIARPKNHSKAPWFFEMDKLDGEVMRSESNWKWGI